MKRTSIAFRLIIFSLVLTFLLAAAAPVMGAPDKTRVWIEFAPGTKGAVHSALQGAGAQFHYTFDDLNSFVVTLPAQALKGLARNPNVVDIEEDAPRYPVSSTASKGALAPVADVIDANGQIVPWGIDAVQARDVWDTDLDGAIDPGVAAGTGITVCIIDTGFYAAHEDLSGIDLIGGMSQVDDDWARDGYGHGSHVAGTVAAVNNDIGVVGVAPNVSLYIVKYFDDTGLATYASDLVAAINTCYANGAKVISMSLSGTRANTKERRAFDTLYSNGVLSIAAASNDGGTTYAYPASYSSVVSVAALDEALNIADFSQQNDQVEIAAPGVAVLSTIPYIDSSSLTVGGTAYQANHIEFSARGSASGTLVDGGLCTTTGAWAGAVVLCQRGDISFLEKVMNVQNSGGAAAVIYNNEPGNFYGTLGEGESSAIIGLSLSQDDGLALIASSLGATGTVSSTYTWPASGYEAWDGTSMATPHVSAVAALLWSQFPSATNVQIREAMNATALDLGAAGRDVAFGYGLVQAADALALLGGGGGGETLSVSVATNKASYVDRETVAVTVTVTDGSAPVVGASVTATITTAKNTVKTFSGTTGANGEFSFNYRISTRKDGTGIFTVDATATMAGYESGSGSTTFIVN